MKKAIQVPGREDHGRFQERIPGRGTYEKIRTSEEGLKRLFDRLLKGCV